MKEVAKKSLVIKAFLGAAVLGLLLAIGLAGPTLQPPQALADTLTQQAFTACGSAATISDCTTGYIAGYNGTPQPKNSDGFYKQGYTLGVQAKAAAGGGTTSGDTKPPSGVSRSVAQKGFDYCNNSFSADVGNCTAGYEWGYTGGAKPTPCNAFCVGGYAQGVADIGQARANPPAGCPGSPTAAELGACQAGVDGFSSGKSETDSCNSYSGGNLAACKAAWEAAQSAAAVTPEDQCNADAVTLGWVLCPIIDLANKTINTIINSVLVPQLKVVPLSSSSPEYAVWQNIRTLANVVFVLAFMVVIFANTLQFNIETYAIKKMLPRLVAAVVLVQFSFVISSVIVDMGNILGDGITGLINLGITSHLKDASGHIITYGSSGSGVLSSLGAALVAGVAVSLTALAVGVPTLVLLIIGGFISVMGVLITLIARRFIIILLVVVSPLAFAVWVLPNTENYFKMWLNNFIKISLMYPIIMLLLSVASIGTVAVSGGDPNAGLIGAIFPIIAFFMIPMTFKWAGSAMGFASGKISGVTKSSKSGAQGAWKNSEAYKSRQALRAANKQAKLAIQAQSKGLKGYIGGVRTRGDFLGGNRGFKASNVLRRKSPLYKDPSLERLKIRKQQQFRDESLAARMEVDENVLKGLQEKIIKTPGKASRPEIENAIVAMAAQRKKYKYNDPNALPSLHRAMKSAGMSDEEIYQANDFIVGQDYASMSATNPAAAMTRLPGKEYIDVIEAPTFERDEDGHYVRDANGERIGKGIRHTKLVGEDSFFVGQMKDGKTEKLLTGLNAQGTEELIDTKVQTSEGNVSALDYILDHKPGMIEAAKSDPRIYNNTSGAVITRIAEHARQVIKERTQEILRQEPALTEEQVLDRIRQERPQLLEAAEFDTAPGTAAATPGSGGGSGSGGTGGSGPSTRFNPPASSSSTGGL